MRELLPADCIGASAIPSRTGCGRLSRVPRRKSTDLERMQAAATLWESDEQEIGYQASVLCGTSLPYRRPPGDPPYWTRRNGHLSLTLTPGRDGLPDGTERFWGYPYGSIPRLILTWASTEAVRTRSRQLDPGNSLSEFLRQVMGRDYRVTGGARGSMTRLRKQTEALFRSRLSIEVDQGADVDMAANLSIASAWRIRWPNSEKSSAPDQADRVQYVVLGAEFYESVVSSPVPLDVGALQQLKESAPCLDIYYWLSHRLSYLERPSKVPWDALRWQFGSNFADTRQGRSQFKSDFVKNLNRVLLVYKGANVEALPDGLVLKRSRTHVSPRGTTRSRLRAIERGLTTSKILTPEQQQLQIPENPIPGLARLPATPATASRSVTEP